MTDPIVRSTDDQKSEVGKTFMVPASFSQRRLWFLDQLEPGSPNYNIAAAVEIEGPLRVNVFERSLREIVRRHESLRTHFDVVDGEIYQVIEESLDVHLRIHDLTSIAVQDRKPEIERRAREEANTHFDLSRGPLIQVSLLQFSEHNHVVLWRIHHSIADGWSMGVFIRELVAIYGAFAAGRPSPLSDLPIQYADFSEWQRGWITGERMDKHLEYWKKHLSGAEPLDLLLSYVRPPVLNYAGSTICFTINRELTRRMRELGWAHNATLYMVLLAAFQTLLYRYTSQTDISVGTPIAGRSLSETEQLIGLFVNTLVIRTELAAGWNFLQLLQKTKAVLLEAHAHQDLPFEKLVEALVPQRDLARSPLFQVMFVLQNTPRVELRLEGVRIRNLPIDHGIAKFEIMLTLDEHGDDVTAQLEYNTTLFSAGAARRMVDHFQTLLLGIVDDPSRQLGQLPLLNSQERQQLLIDWNQTTVPRSWKQTVVGRIEQQARLRPGAVAVSSEGGWLSYEELDRRGNQLAHYLRRGGIGPERCVGICMHRSLEMVVGMAGILKAGGVYVPLDPSYPADRLDYMMRDCGVDVILTQQHLASGLAGYRGRILPVDSAWAEIAKERTKNPEVEIDGANLMYVIYTSGSTGVPKGAMLTHSAVLNHMLWLEREFAVGAENRVLQKTSYNFDVSVLEFFLPLMTGGELVMAEPGGHGDVGYIRSVVQERKITMIYFVPSMLELFVECPGLEECRSLRHIFCGGEAIPLGLPERLFSKLKVELHNLYGPTETCIHSTGWSTRAEEMEQHNRLRGVPIGQPIDNTTVFVLDLGMEPVPIGVAGELYIGGAGLARGYWGLPERTGEGFVPNPFSGKGGERLYRTGDRVRWRMDGELEFLGRLDQQVKLRGHRIELGEIEAVLRNCEGVDQAVVVMRQDSPGDKCIVGYVVPAGGAQRSGLREELKRRLPEYMVPSALVFLKQLPLLANGKLDRRRLPAPGGEDGTFHSGYVAPRTPVEHQIAGIWSEVLPMAQISVEDNFFEIGGHSLSAARVAARMSDVFNIEVPLRKLFEAPTITALAVIVEQFLSESNRSHTGATSRIEPQVRQKVALPQLK